MHYIQSDFWRTSQDCKEILVITEIALVLYKHFNTILQEKGDPTSRNSENFRKDHWQITIRKYQKI